MEEFYYLQLLTLCSIKYYYVKFLNDSYLPSQVQILLRAAFFRYNKHLRIFVNGVFKSTLLFTSQDNLIIFYFVLA